MSIFIGVSIIILAGAIAKHWIPYAVGRRGHGAAAANQRDVQANSVQQYSPSPQITAKALETYERLAKEKLEVLKTALAMGYKDDDLAALDARLERLVGRDKLAEILRGADAGAMASADLLDTQLDHEIDRLRDMRQKAQQ
jgi:hypothetical protein